MYKISILLKGITTVVLIQPNKIIATEYTPDLLGNNWLAKAVDANGNTITDPLYNKGLLEAWGTTKDRAVHSLFARFSLKLSPIVTKPL